MNRNYETCKIKLDTDNFLKDRTACKSCQNRNRRKNIPFEKENCTSHYQTKFQKRNNNENNPRVSGYENHRHVIVDPSNSCKT